MDKGEAIEIVRNYKHAIADKFSDAKVYLYGSYSKGTAHKDSDIDVAVIVPKIDGDFLMLSAYLWHKVDDVNFLIEPILMEDGEPSPLFEDVMKTGVAV